VLIPLHVGQNMLTWDQYQQLFTAVQESISLQIERLYILQRVLELWTFMSSNVVAFPFNVLRALLQRSLRQWLHRVEQDQVRLCL
jgi:hypothetical protein